MLVTGKKPLGLCQFDTMRRMTEAVGIVLPAMPVLYHQPLTIMDLIDFVVARICDQLGRPAAFAKRWGDSSSAQPGG